MVGKARGGSKNGGGAAARGACLWLLAVAGCALMGAPQATGAPQAWGAPPASGAPPAAGTPLEAPRAMPPSELWSLHGQLLLLPQGHLGLRSPYAGAHSLAAPAALRIFGAATVYAAARPWPGGLVVLDPELTFGDALGGALGVGAGLDGAAFRTQGALPRPDVARAFVAQSFGLGGPLRWQGSGPNQLAQPRASRRIEVLAGKFSLADYFDRNAFAGHRSEQFFAAALQQAGAYGYAANTRGYTLGAYAAVHLDAVTLRLALAMVPHEPNAMALDWCLWAAHGDSIEVEVRHRLIGGRAGTWRLLFFDSRGSMGSYSAALAGAAQPPSLRATRAYRHRPGAALSLEQHVRGGTGAFIRLGVADGAREAFTILEVDASLALGAQLDGALWGRENDRAGVGYHVGGIAAGHAAYLARGGLGFALGDGGLRAGVEQLAEAYYRYVPLPYLAASLGLQLVLAPGYNRDRGPVAVAGVRLQAFR